MRNKIIGIGVTAFPNEENYLSIYIELVNTKKDFAYRYLCVNIKTARIYNSKMPYTPRKKIKNDYVDFDYD